MGIQQTVRFSGNAPDWPGVRDLLRTRGLALPMRMIDGQLAFPDELPSEEWEEIRVGSAAGMVTIKRFPGRVDLVTWGNADAELSRIWNAIAWAWAEAGNGTIETLDGKKHHETFSRRWSFRIRSATRDRSSFASPRRTKRAAKSVAVRGIATEKLRAEYPWARKLVKLSKM